MEFRKHIIQETDSVKNALIMLDKLAADAILFAVDHDGVLTGSLTDGDIRRGLMAGSKINHSIRSVCYKTPKYINQKKIELTKLIDFRQNNFNIIPIVDENNIVVDVINFKKRKTILPVDVVIMAGGKGMRLRPLTVDLPKPLLKVGDKSILEHSLLMYDAFGVKSINITTNYLSQKIEDFIEQKKNDYRTTIETVKESQFLGTIGAIKLVKNFSEDYILVSNSDLLTDIDFEAFFLDFVESDADMSVVSIPYHVDIPYAIMDIEDDYLKSFHEKPKYTYYSNGGIYLLKKELLNLIPMNEAFSATDLMNAVISQRKKIKTFAHNGYWLDIGQHQDYKKAQNDIKTLKLL
jgi:dTDP-glucose pyrophosphorylase